MLTTIYGKSKGERGIAALRHNKSQTGVVVFPEGRVRVLYRDEIYDRALEVFTQVLYAPQAPGSIQDKENALLVLLSRGWLNPLW